MQTLSIRSISNIARSCNGTLRPALSIRHASVGSTTKRIEFSEKLKQGPSFGEFVGGEVEEAPRKLTGAELRREKYVAAARRLNLTQ